MLNYTQDGRQVGDFSLEEVQQLLGSGPSGPQQPAPRVTTTRSAIEAMIGRVTPEQAKFLQGALGLLDQRMAQSGQDYQDDVQQANVEMQQFQGILSDMMDRADTVRGLAESLSRKQAADDEMAAERQKQADLVKNETERQMTAIKLNEQKRQIEASNARKINSMTNRLAIAGGFGSMGGIKAIEDAQAEGDRAVARFVNEIALTDQQYLDRAISIDATYTNTIVKIHRDHSDALLAAVTKYNDRVDEVQKLAFGSMQKRNEAVRTAKNKMRDEWDKLHEKTLGLLGDAVKETGRKADALRKEQYQKSKDQWSQAMNYINAYGTQDQGQLATYEQNLGLAPGSLSKYKTLAEIRLLRHSGNGTPSGGQQVQDYVGTLRTQIIRAHPDFTPEQVDSALLESTQNNYSGQKNAGFRIAVQNYVNDNNYDPSAGFFRWEGEGATFTESKPYFVNYKFRPQFEQTVVQLDDGTLAGLASLDE